MKAIILFILSLTTLQVVAQNHLIGIRGGASWTNVTSISLRNLQDYRQGVSGGLSYEYFLKNNISIGADAIYNQRGFTDGFRMDNGNEVNVSYNMDYLSVPMKAGFYDIRNKLFGFAKAGVIPSLLVNAKVSQTGTEPYDVTNSSKKFDLAGLVEVGGGYKIVDRLWLTASFVYQQSLTPTSKREESRNGFIVLYGEKTRHSGMTVDFGVKWRLNKE